MPDFKSVAQLQSPNFTLNESLDFDVKLGS